MSIWARLLCAALVILSLFGFQTAARADAEVQLQVRVATPLYKLSPTSLNVPGYTPNDSPGAPALPVYGTIITLPGAGNWTLSVSDPGVTPLPERVTLLPVPTQTAAPSNPYAPAMPRAEDALPTTISLPDASIYRTDALYPTSVVSVGQEQWAHGERLLPIRVFPFQYNPVTHKLLYHPDVQITIHVTPTASAVSLSSGASANVPGAILPASPRGEVGALRLRTSQPGLHRLTYSDLHNDQIDVGQVDPASFLITYLGQPVRIMVTGVDDNSFDAGDLVIFYAEPYVGRWMTSNVYRFSYGTDPAPANTRITSRTVAPSGSEPLVTTIYQTLHIEQNTGYFSDYWTSVESDRIFDTAIPDPNTGLSSRSYPLSLDDPAPTGQMTVSGLLYGKDDQGANPDEWAKLQINSHDAGVYTWDGRKPYTITATIAPMTWLDQPANQLTLLADPTQLPGISQYWYYPDFLDVTYPAYADAEGDRIEIKGFDTTGTSAKVQVTGFTTAAVRVFDVRDPRNPVQILTKDAALVNGATQITFWDAWTANDPPPAYSLSTDEKLIAPSAIEVDAPSNWKSPDHQADYIAIVHRSLWDAIDPLLNQRSAQGLRVAKVDVQDIYDEFNYGRLHQQAIHDFLAHAYANWNAGGPRPKYVLLVGDATFDFKAVFGPNMKVLVPAFLGTFDPWMGETASDNRFVTFDGPNDRLPEMLIGRVPAQNALQVQDYVDKVLAYENKSMTPDGPWQNQVAYVADDDENTAGNFHTMSDDIRLNWLPSYYTSTSVYYNPNGSPAGGYTSAGAMKSGIKQAFDNGQILLQWFGHASKYRWGTISGIWNTFDPVNLNANGRTPFVAAFSCLEGYFINIDSDDVAWSMVLGEQHLLQQGRGGIVGLSPSGKHVGSALTVLDQGLTKSIFQDRLAVAGEAVDAAKRYYYANAGGWLDVLDTSIFFGDPALKLRLPLPPAVPPIVGLGIGPAQSATLTWSHLEADTSYKVWRGVSPYFNADAEGAQVGSVDAVAGGYAIGATVSLPDNGAIPPPPVTVIGDPATNYYWLVRGANWRGTSADSNRVGEFDFRLAPGISP